MAFLTANFNPAGGQSRSGSAPQKFTYRTTDSLATCDSSGYFNTVAALLNIGDMIEVIVVDSVSAPTAVSGFGTLIVQSNTGTVVDTYDTTRTITVTATMADVSTASSSWVVSPVAGLVKKIYLTINAAITGSDSALSAKIGGVAITSATGTAVVSGSAAGTVFTLGTPTALNTVTAGGAIELVTDGASSTTSIGTWTVEIVPTTTADTD